VTRAERIRYHAVRVREAIRQTEDPQVRAFGDCLVILDHLAYDHARDAAHAAREKEETC
jgi:hypothetical protein